MKVLPQFGAAAGESFSPYTVSSAVYRLPFWATEHAGYAVVASLVPDHYVTPRCDPQNRKFMANCIVLKEAPNDGHAKHGDVWTHYFQDTRTANRQTRSSRYVSRNVVNSSATVATRSSAIAEKPRDASCQMKSCQLLRNSAETICTTSPEPSISCR